MLAGRYPSDEFAELRPRIIWDRTAGVLRGRPGARRLAVTNAGTIPDRGLFGVFIAGGAGGPRRRARRGDGLRGARRPGHHARRLVVADRGDHPRPRARLAGAGRPGRRAVLEGRGRRPAVRARRGDRQVRARAARGARPEGAATSTSAAERNLLAFLREQEKATGALPSDRTVVVERFRDEIGDWRVCILTPFGARVHAPWAMAVGARLRESLGLEVQSIWSDDGIAFHLPDADSPPATDLLLLDPDELEELVLAEVGQTALFGARFRENAARALLIPRRRPGERTPLWQQRLKAQGLLQVARKYSSFPIVLETYRECLQDVFDLPALKRLLGRLRARELDLVDVETASASPFASSLLFDYIATYMYEDDTPPAERRAQALSLDRDLLRELLGQEELRELIDAAALAEVEASLRPFPQRSRAAPRPAAPARRPARAASSTRRTRRSSKRSGARSACASPARSGSLRSRMRAGTATRSASCPPSGLPAVFLEPVPDALRSLVARWARGRGPFTTRAGIGVVRPRRRGGAARARARGEARPRRAPSRRHRARVVRSRRPAAAAAGVARGACAARSSRSSRLRSAASCPSWHGIDRRASLREALIPLQALALPVALWEAEVLPRRVPDYRPEQLDQLCASGELVWVGAGLDRVAVFFRDDAPLLGRAVRRVRYRKARRTTRFAPRSPAARSSGTGSSQRPSSTPRRRFPALWDLVWSGEVTNDSWSPLRAERRYQPPRPDRRARRFSRARAHRPTATQGRWSLAAELFAGGEPDRRALAELLLERHGIVTRDSVRAEGIPGGYSAVYGGAARARDARLVPARLLRRRARRGAVRARRSRRAPARAAAARGRRAGAARARRRRSRRSRTAPCSRGRSAPGARAARVAGAHVVLLGGEPALFVERGGRSLVPLREPDDEWLRPALAALVGFVKRGGAKRLAVERFDGEPVTETLVMPLLVEAGFLAGPRRAVLRA